MSQSNVEQNRGSVESNKWIDESVEILLEYVKEEYNHEVERTERLINKISIAYTVSNAVIAYEMSNYSLKSGSLGGNILFIVSICLLLISLGILIYVFCGIKTIKMNIPNYIKKGVLYLSPQQLNKFLLAEYCRINKTNRKIINDLFKKINVMIVIMAISVLLFVLITFFFV